MTGINATSIRWALVVALMAAIIPPCRAAVRVGDRPQFEFATTDGRQISSESLRGRIVVLDFWATWCGPCVAAMPHMKELHRQYDEQGVQIIGISADSSRSKLDQFVKRERIPWPQFFDDKDRMSRQFDVTGIPDVFILSPDGEVLWNGHPNRMDEPLADALRDHPPRLEPQDKLSEAQRDAAVVLLREARRAIDAGDFALMLDKLSQVHDETLANRRVKGSVRILAKKLDIQVKDRTALDEAIAANPEAGEKLNALLELVAPKQAGASGENAAPYAVHPQLAARKLAQADAAREDTDHHRAYALYLWLVDRTPDSEQGILAADHVAAYEADDAFMAELSKKQAEDEARQLLAMAKNYEAAGNPDLAKRTYEKVLEKYPAAEQCCAEAKAALKALDRGS